MDKKKQKKGSVKRKSGDDNVDSDVKKQKVITRNKNEDSRCTSKKVEMISQQNVEYSSVGVHNQHQQLVESATSQMEGQGQAQPVFFNLKGEQVQLGPNTVIVYEQGNNAGSFAFSGNLVMDASGRIVMADTIYDVKEGSQEEHTFVNTEEEGGSILPDKSSQDMDGELMQYTVCKVEDTDNDCYEGNQEATQGLQQNQTNSQEQRQEFEIVHVVEGEQNPHESSDAVLSDATARWLSSKYDFVVRKLQLDHDAGVKLLHSPNGILKCIYLTTPSMQLAFHSVPQFLCIESGIEFRSAVSGSAEYVRQVVTLILAEDGNGKSVIVSAGISPLGDDNIRWLLETFKSCNPAWRQVRCIVTDPEQHSEDIKWCFPGADICSNVFQVARWSCRQVSPSPSLATLKAILDSVLKGQDSIASTNRLAAVVGTLYKRILKLLEADNFTNVLHKGIERVVEKFEPLTTSSGLQPEEFVPFFFQIVRGIEEGRRLYALSRLQDTINSKQSPTDTITQYAYFLIHQQTVLAQRALNQKAGSSDKEGPGSIRKYGTSTQECSCQFSKVFRLPCRHILMLTTELKIKTHIPFEPRWTVHHCLFGCEMENRSGSPNSQNENATGSTEIKHQYVMSNGNGQQVVYCTTGGTSDTQYIPEESTGQPA